MSQTILVCDDEELIRWSLSEHLTSEGYTVVEAEDGEDCLEKLTTFAPDLLITDLKMPRMDGMEVLRRLRQQGRDLPVIVLTAHGEVQSAVQATQLGATNYLTKPFDLIAVGLAVEKALESHRLESELQLLRGRRGGYGKLLGQSLAMRKLFDTLRRLESIDAPTVLLSGESGTGKDIIAHAIHDSGPRSGGPMMEVDCASLPEQLIESELFGHERGSFTDAKATKKGMFEVARGGTIFLDEIGEMSPATQAKLLRAIENRTFRRVGGTSPIRLDASVIAASNRDLQNEVAGGRFREDLYFRLAVIKLEVPALRERREDIPLLVQHFVQRFNNDFHKKVEEVTGDAMRRLQEYAWPGNVRELRNVIERIVILEADARITLEELPPEIRYGRTAVTGATFLLPEEGVDLDEVERSFIQQAMDRTNGNQSAAARLLGISRYALRYRLQKLEERGS